MEQETIQVNISSKESIEWEQYFYTEIYTYSDNNN